MKRTLPFVVVMFLMGTDPKDEGRHVLKELQGR
jgi:hypothetical protein